MNLKSGSKDPRSKLRGIAEIEVRGPGSTRVPGVGLGVSPEPSEPRSAGHRAQQARRLRSPDLRNSSRSKLWGIRPRGSKPQRTPRKNQEFKASECFIPQVNDYRYTFSVLYCFLCPLGITWLVNLVTLRGILNTKNAKITKAKNRSRFLLCGSLRSWCSNSEGFHVLAPGHAFSLVAAMPLYVLSGKIQLHFPG